MSFQTLYFFPSKLFAQDPVEDAFFLWVSQQNILIEKVRSPKGNLKHSGSIQQAPQGLHKKSKGKELITNPQLEPKQNKKSCTCKHSKFVKGSSPAPKRIDKGAFHPLNRKHLIIKNGHVYLSIPSKKGKQELPSKSSKDFSKQKILANQTESL